MRPLIRHLRVSGQLTAGLILRALLSGNVVLFEEALAELTDMPVERVSSLVHDSGSAGLRALFDQARLPPSTYPAFKEAIEAMREGGLTGEPGGAARLKRRMIERVLTRCKNEALGELAPLHHAVAPLRHRGRARGGAAVLRRTRCRNACGREPFGSGLVRRSLRLGHFLVI